MSSAGASGASAGLAIPLQPKPESHFLDTNAYALLLSGNPADADARLRTRLACGTHVEAVISELTSLEIHSVLGKLSRGGSAGLHACDRTIESLSGLISCPNRWHQPAKRALRPLELERLRKSVRDAESGHGPIRLAVIPLETSDFTLARSYLYAHASKFQFGSHDAVIAAAAMRNGSGSTRLVTSDKGLKALLREIGLKYFDPLTDSEWNL